MGKEVIRRSKTARSARQRWAQARGEGRNAALLGRDEGSDGLTSVAIFLTLLQKYWEARLCLCARWRRKNGVLADRQAWERLCWAVFWR